MKKQLLFSRFCHVFFCVFTGNLFKTGKNATMYKYIDSDGDENNFSTELKCIWIGYSFPLKKFKGFSYDVALTLNGFNSIVGIPSANIRENAVCRGSKCYFLRFVK
jgi:hypothetical protein